MHVRRTISLAAAVAWIAVSAPAQEHPEHPKKDAQKTAEHPEHPQKDAASPLTTEQLAAGIRNYITQDAKVKGGFFLVYDAVDKKPLQLTLVKVHDDKLAGLGDGVYFACTDLSNADGVVYDLDFFMKQTPHGLETTEIAVHKKNGKPRYGWKEENGLWRKVSQ